MALSIQNLKEVKTKLDSCDVNTFGNVDNSYVWFIKSIKIDKFRHIRNLQIDFNHPVTAITGTNRSGKTSLLLLLACSHERFMRLDASSSSIGVREHNWSDVLSFTTHENVEDDYQYSMNWRKGIQNLSGIGKRLHTSKAWSGLGKKSSDPNRVNAKIRDREVRLVDLERLLPGRAFSDSLYKKANVAVVQPLHQDIAQAFSYIFSTPVNQISEAGGHVNRKCFIIQRGETVYSTYNAASGEEALIYLLKDLIESPKNSLILIDEIEAGFHPSVQRRIIEVFHLVAWRDKKQIIFTTHSPTVLSTVSRSSRRFLENANGAWRCISGISLQAASSKMDSIGHPLIQLYCEDELAGFLVAQQMVGLAGDDPHFDRLINVVPSGPIDQVKTDYVRHKRNFLHLRNKLGYCALFDGDHLNDPLYSSYHQNSNDYAAFIYPYEAPEKFLVRAYLTLHPNEILAAALQHVDHHALFDQMVDLGLAADRSDARNRCYEALKATPEYNKHAQDIQELLMKAITHFSALPD